MGFIGLDRGIVDHWIYQDAEYFKVWFEMLYRARYSLEPSMELIEGQLTEIKYGEFIFGRIKWSERLGISERRLRTLMDKLVAENMIVLIKRAPKFSLYCVSNFAKYRPQIDQQETQSGQGFEEDGDHQNDQQATSKRPADVQQATTKEQRSNKATKQQGNKKDTVYSPEFESFFDSYPRQIGKPAAFNNFKKLIKKGIGADYLMHCAMNYQSYCVANETETQYIKMPNNFLNPKDDYYKQFESPVLIHSRGRNGQAKPLYTRQQDKFDQMLMEEVEKENDPYRNYQAY